MAEKKAFVCGGDHNYFPMMLEWVHSIRTFEQAEGFDICILDSGLKAEQIEILKPLVTKIYAPDWPCEIPERKIRGRTYLKSCICRPFINQYFPGYDLYFWMDADTWVQNWRAVEMFLEGARRKKICLTGQVDRAYPRQIRVKWLGRWPWKVRGFYFSNALKAFGFENARALLPYHVLLAGAFALHKDAPHWEKWQSLVVRAVKKGKVFTAEQLCLGMMCYVERYPYEILPGWAHWLCEFKPFYNKKTKQFVEPYLPHEPLGILHMSGFDEMRIDRSVTTDFRTLEEDDIALSYRYPYYDGEKNEAIKV